MLPAPWLASGLPAILWAVAPILVVLPIRRRRRAPSSDQVEAQLRRVYKAMETMAHGVTICDGQGRILYVNPAQAAMYGAPVGELLGRRGSLFAPGGGGAAAVSLPTPVWRHWKREALNTTVDGRIIPVELTSDGIFDGSGELIGRVTICEDLTERKQAEQELRDSEARYRRIFESVQDVYYELAPDGTILDVSPSVEPASGYRTGELVGRPVQGFYAEPPDRWVMARALARDGVVRDHEVLMRRRDGSAVPCSFTSKAVLDEAGRHVRTVGTLRDISARKRAEETLRRAHDELERRVSERTIDLESVNALLRVQMVERERAQEALKQSERRYRELVEGAPDIIYTAAGEEGIFTSLNSAFEKLTGWPRAQWLGRPFLPLIHADDQDSATENYRRVLGGETPPRYELRVRCSNGTYLSAELSTLPRVQDGKTELFGVARDNTVRRKLEEQLLQAQKLEAVGRLAGGVAHDFNNLLQAILSMVQSLQYTSGAGSEPLGELAAHVRKGAGLTRQLLLFARRSPSHPERVDLGEAVQSSSRLLRRLLRENIALQVELAPDPLPVEADRGQLEQVLMNLVINASDAMPGGGSLCVRTGNEGGKHAYIEVIDTGTGMTDEVKARIFEPFFTTKPADKGTGLGLSVVHGIVAKHGGSIDVTSAPGRGTTFRVSLPLQASSVPPVASTGPAEVVTPGSVMGHVLVVEDEGDVRRAIQQMLMLLSYQVTVVRSGEEAMALPFEEHFDLLLADLMLPGMGGGELATHLLGRFPDLKVVFMSGYTEHEPALPGAGPGGVRFLEKPFDMATLARELKAALRGEPGAQH